MALLKLKPVISGDDPADKTAEVNTLEQIGVHVHLAFRHLQMHTDQLKHLVWENPYGLTPAEVLTVLDRDGSELDVILKKLITAHNDITPASEERPEWVPEDKTVTEKDGVLTVADKIEVPK